MGLFGNSASIIVDLNLILQYLSLILLILGYFRRKRFKNHGQIMQIVTLIAFFTIISVMGPHLVLGYATYEPTILFHVGAGLLATFLGLLFNFRFIKALRDGQPLTCGTKNIMRLAFVLWLIPIIGGTLLYLTRYVWVIS